MTDTQSRHYPEPGSHHAAKGPSNTIACRICEAVYTPSQEHAYLLQAPPRVLESALMSMCHFCFRCRRPACPHCWDNIHGVCGECCLEANLPFRAQTAPLRGVLFATTRQAQLRRKHATPVRLICIRPGRFQSAASIDTAETFPLQNAIIPPRATASRQAPSEGAPLVERHQPQLMPAYQEQPPAPRRRKTIDIYELATKPPPSEIVVKPLNIDQMVTQPPPRTPHTVTQHARHTYTFGEFIEQVITTLLCLVLLCIIALIMLGMLSVNADALIQHYLHVDIRAEVTALWQLMLQVHF